jgi:hypothetical protein
MGTKKRILAYATDLDIHDSMDIIIIMNSGRNKIIQKIRTRCTH